MIKRNVKGPEHIGPHGHPVKGIGPGGATTGAGHTPMQPGHRQESHHPGRKTGAMPGQQHEMGRHANQGAHGLVKHMIGSKHTERTTTHLRQAPAEGMRQPATTAGGMQGLRPQHTPGMSGTVDGPEGPSAMHPQPKAMPVKTKIHHKKVGSQSQRANY